MRIGGRLAAAIEILEDMQTRHRPAAEALRDWGASHRFAGAGDRAAIGNIVYDGLRHRATSRWRFGADTARADAYGALLSGFGLALDEIASQLDGDRFAPTPLTKEETESWRQSDLSVAPGTIRANAPEWSEFFFLEGFGEDWVSEAAGLAARPPVDLRVNTLKADVAKVTRALQKDGVHPTEIARNGLRIPPVKGFGRHPNIQATPEFEKGWFEIQDEGSQIVADLIFAQPKEQVLDFCAGGGGKTLALAAAMENRGQIHAYDADRGRLAPIVERLKRAGVRNVQVHSDRSTLEPLKGKIDRVVIDAPCTGSGTWRRKPDAKWRLTEAQLRARQSEQAAILDEASSYVRPGGYLVYITCSMFRAENEEQIYAFGERHEGWDLLSAGEVWQDLFGFDKPSPWSEDLNCITLTPAATDTDGFFFAVMQKMA
ncbi:RsmB/NOP family class I SAM-dependent RNA methyltransferase [Notoacmeibacter sp. MSK16QG-6]|uniref:RsmB/NOP family class I SAM-dependent RNA methyltransferase n=1 Tax=Notoacmeibacter sp. MSK16QG-6 TaxID=2957982 RepID=UPI00209EDB9F|nr:RsmB/NOP family class I SAM-dependent RNA methyltransferase [Notoacmeibacter sp. MSK16QG-6]MCP1198402.1 RsmB/NOP family class I SAM-dependent RNA methyltransferase [Notoacmeibacter sp. MSK16QG-6]